MSTAKFEVEKFTGRNDFGLWRLKMKAILMQQGLWDILKGGDSEEKLEAPDEKEKSRLQEMQYKAYSTLILNLSDRVLREVAKEDSASGVWSKLEGLYMTKSLANRLHLKQKLLTFKIMDGKGLSEQLEDFGKCIDDLENIDEEIKDEDKALMLLNSLPKSYEHFKDAMLLGRESKISYEEVNAALKLKDTQRSSVRQPDQLAESLYLKNDQKKNQKKKFQKKQDKEKSESGKETRSCHYCKKPGHLKKSCFAWKRKQEQEKIGGPDTADIAQEVQAPEALNIHDGASIEESWIMDSGCTYHICSHKSWFHNLECSQGSVILGNDQTCEVKGIGDIKLKVMDGSIKVLTEVRFIPKIKRNLISLGLLESKGCKFSSESGFLRVTKGSRIILEAKRKHSLYYLLAETVTGSADITQHESLSSWHTRLGHVGEKGIRELVKQGAIKADASEGLEKCEPCILGKAKKLPFTSGKHTSTAPFAYAHSDLWGPSQVESMSGGKYFISIIDDYSRKVWVYILKDKSQAFEKFQEWHNRYENEKGSVLKCLRTDNGMEFLSSEFEGFCKLKGIKRHRTAPRNPQQNGIVERMNRTLLERVRCMLFSSGLPKKFWAEAVTTAAVLINKCPSSAISNEIPDKRWYGSLGDYSGLRSFGCAAYAHVKQNKLEPRAKKCVMLGYQDGVKAYRLWNLERGEQKIIISRDVSFNEAEMPFKRELPANRVSSADLQSFEFDEEASRLDSDEEDEAVVDHDEGGAQPQYPQENAQQAAADTQMPRRNPTRNTRLPSRFSDYDMSFFALCVAEVLVCTEPSTYEEAIKGKESQKWIKAMGEEIESLLRNGTWILVENPETQKLISCKWIFKKKVEVGEVETIRFKARLVARGFTQVEGIDFTEVFSPVVKHTSIRILLALAAYFDWELHQLDVKTAFLHGDLEETIYMMQPKGFEKPGEEHKVCLLKKSLYGLKQSSRQWNLKFHEHMQSIGFERSSFDSCVYLKKKGEVIVAYLLLYVDDILLAGSCKKEIQLVKDDLKMKFEMKDLGEARRILGMDILRNRKKKELRLIQADYVDKVIKKYQMSDSRSVSIPLANHFKLSKDQMPKTDQERLEMSLIPYANIVGSVMYLMICTRPDVAHAISVASRYMSDPGMGHWDALKWILKYLKGSRNVGLQFGGGAWSDDDDILEGFCDSDYAANMDNRKSQSGYVFTLFGTAISWKSNLQSVVALSTTEAEYISLTEAAKEGKWLQGMLQDLGMQQGAVKINCDSNSAICLAKHQMFHERSKHIDVRRHFIRDEIRNGKIDVVKVPTEENASDMLTKALPVSKFKHCLELLEVVEC